MDATRPEEGRLGRISETVSAVIGFIETAFAAAARLCLFLIMMIVVADVLLRYVFHTPLAWSYTLIGSYLMVALFFLMLSNTLHVNHHIAIDIFQGVFPLRVRELALGVGYLASAVVMGLIAWHSWLRWTAALQADERLAAAIPWPTWITYAILTVGVVLFVLRTVHRACLHIAAAVIGRPLVATDPVAALPGQTEEISIRSDVNNTDRKAHP
jgi:TRAP-type C4-dicarboxylate transport system permease small subunit